MILIRSSRKLSRSLLTVRLLAASPDNSMTQVSPSVLPHSARWYFTQVLLPGAPSGSALGLAYYPPSKKSHQKQHQRSPSWLESWIWLMMPRFLIDRRMELPAVAQLTCAQFSPRLNSRSQIVVFTSGLPLFRTYEPILRVPISITVASTGHFTRCVVDFCVRHDEAKVLRKSPSREIF